MNLPVPEPRRFLANDIPSRAIEQPNQVVQQNNCHSQHASNQVSNA